MQSYSPHFIPASSPAGPAGPVGPVGKIGFGDQLWGTADADLLRRAARDDAHAFDTLFHRHRDGLQGFLFRRLRSYEEVEDALSLTFVNAWRARGMFRGEAPGKAWLYQIASRVAIDLLRSRRRRAGEQEWDPEAAELLTPLRDEAPEPEDLVMQDAGLDETRRSVAAAMKQLAPEEQRLVRMFYFEERSYEEISELLGISRSQVRGRLHRIRSRMRQHLGRNTEA